MKLALGCFAATVLLTTAACGPRNQDFEKTADNALESAALDDVDANWDNDAKTIHLTGTVNSEDERQRAADVVQKAVGGGAQVANEVTVANKDEEIAGDLDGGIADRINELADNEPELKDDNVDVEVNNAVVTLTGEVDSAAERDKIGDIARSQPGVKDVINSVEVAAAGANRGPATRDRK